MGDTSYGHQEVIDHHYCLLFREKGIPETTEAKLLFRERGFQNNGITYNQSIDIEVSYS